MKLSGYPYFRLIQLYINVIKKKDNAIIIILGGQRHLPFEVLAREAFNII